MLSLLATASPALALLGTTTSVISSTNPSAFGGSVTFTATVLGVVVTPSGTVTFKDGATTIGTGTLNGAGQASFSTTALAVGSHSITAVYGGDGLYNPSTSSVLTQNVNANSSTTSVVSSVNPSALNQSVIFTATVSSTGGTPTGTVTFKDGIVTLGTVTLSSGQAVFPTNLLLPGNHPITVVYSGDTNFSASTSSVLTQTVTIGTSSTALVSSSNPIGYGQAVTFTATVSGLIIPPTGTVTFKDGAATIGTGNINGAGIATFTTSALALGAHTITAVYGGDPVYNSSTSNIIPQTIAQSTTATAVVSSLNPSVSGASVIFTATVTSAGGTPSGTVTFKDGAATIGTGTLNGSGVTTFSTSALAVGSHSITAVYGGDTNFSTSTSSALTQVVNQASTSTAVTSSLNPSAFGQSVTFTATATSTTGTPTGTVTFKDGATTIGTGTLNGSGVATFTTSALLTGSHAITASYGGDTNFLSSVSPTLTQTVNSATSTTAVVSSLNPSNYGQSIIFTATVASTGGTPTGTVTFKDGAATIGTGTLNGSGQATLTTSALALGSHSITVVYGGDSNFSGSTSSVLTQTVNQASTSTAVVSSVNPSAFGQSVTFTATVTSAGGTPTGTVTFKDGATTLGTGTLNGSGVTTFTTSALVPGSHAITATYGGDTNFSSGVSPALTQTVNTGSSTTAVISSLNPSNYGQSVTFTTTVSGSSNTPTGTVTFKDGAATIGTGTLNGSGQATLTTSALALGSHSITVVYGGDALYAGSTSSALTQTVNQNTSATAVVSSLNPSGSGASVTFTATVTSGGGTPTGTVTFKDGAATIGTGTLDGSGVTTFSTSALTVGSHSITAVYGGDTNFSGSTSSALTQTVIAGNSSVSVVSSVNPSTYGQSVTFTATVVGSSATGTVTFKDGVTTLGTGTLNGGGVATFATGALAAGSHSITAVYGGDSNFSGSTSPTITQSVNQASTSTAVISSVNPSALNQTVTFTATVSSSAGTPTGTVTFKDGATTLGTGTLNGGGIATFATSALLPGSHSITATYGGDTNFSSGISPTLTQTVNPESTTTAVVSSLNPSNYGQSVTFTATVSGSGITPTGTVTFKDGAATIGTGTLDGAGQATLTTSALTVAAHSITVVYGGDTMYAGSTSSILTQTVNQNTSAVALVSSVDPSALSQSVTFTATVTSSGGTPTGTVTFKDGVATIGTGTLNGSGVATFATSALTAGAHSITAVYGGDTNFSTATSSVLTQTVVANSSATALGSSANPSAYGGSVTFTATVTSGGGTPTGTVTFMDGATSLGTGTLNGGVATYTTSALAGGSHSITAVYGGDSLFSASTSPVVTQVVNQNASTSSVVSSLNPSTLGASVTFTATVSGAGGTPGGMVTFKDGATTLGSATLNGSGQATLSTAGLTPGSHSITVMYGGDANYTASTSPVLTQTVNQGAGGVALSSSSNPSAFGAPVTFTATVTGTGATPTGTVTFKDGATTLGTGTLDGAGVTTYSTGALTAGSHAITAVYGGDTNFATATSPVLTQSVTTSTSTVGVTSSANPSIFGSSVTFIATASGTGGTPTGTVTFKDGAATIGSATLSAGQAALSTSALAVGSHSITVVYGGDGNFAAATSPVLTQTVALPGNTTTALTSSASPASIGAPVSFTATVSGSGTPTGSVTFNDGATTIGTGALNGAGIATMATNALTAGSHTITAIYGGDGNYNASTSPPLTQAIALNGSTVGLTSSANPNPADQPLELVATVAGASGTPTGTVHFLDGQRTLSSVPLSSGTARMTVQSLSVGTHGLSARYSGDAVYAAATSPVLSQSVAVPADSMKLRALQVAVTQRAAQISGQAISGAIDDAVSESLSNGCRTIAPSSVGLRLSTCEETTGSVRVRDGFAVFENAARPNWIAWADTRGTEWNTNAAKGDIRGRQINALAGLTYRGSPDLVMGLFGGYEGFNFRSELLGGQIQGSGWTAGAYFGWRLIDDIRFDAGFARSGITYQGTAGTASGLFFGQRTLAKAGLTGVFKLSESLEIEPSTRVFAFWETDQAYVDSLGTLQSERSFMTGRGSAGVKATLTSLWSSSLTIASYVGLYGDYVFNKTDDAAAATSTPTTTGASARVLLGVSLRTVDGTQFSVEGEAGGLGGDSFTTWSLRTRASVSF